MSYALEKSRVVHEPSRAEKDKKEGLAFIKILGCTRSYAKYFYTITQQKKLHICSFSHEEMK
jgi:hypothetical protein